MNSRVFDVLIDHAYRYASPGYSDWPRYKDEFPFKEGLCCYIDPPNRDFLKRSGVRVEDLLWDMMERMNPGFI